MLVYQRVTLSWRNHGGEQSVGGLNSIMRLCLRKGCVVVGDLSWHCFSLISSAKVQLVGAWWGSSSCHNSNTFSHGMLPVLLSDVAFVMIYWYLLYGSVRGIGLCYTSPRSQFHDRQLEEAPKVSRVSLAQNIISLVLTIKTWDWTDLGISENEGKWCIWCIWPIKWPFQ
jgi:hypothetical protein